MFRATKSGKVSSGFMQIALHVMDIHPKRWEEVLAYVNHGGLNERERYEGGLSKPYGEG
jgi:hypothetical protein